MAVAARAIPAALAQASEGLILVLDIADMTQINLRHGVLTGDRVLSEVEAALRAAFPERGDCVARLPGDQFIVVLPGQTAVGQRSASAKQAVLRVRVRSRSGRAVAVRAHIGAACWDVETPGHVALRSASAGLKSAPRPSWP